MFLLRGRFGSDETGISVVTVISTRSPNPALTGTSAETGTTATSTTPARNEGSPVFQKEHEAELPEWVTAFPAIFRLRQMAFALQQKIAMKSFMLNRDTAKNTSRLASVSPTRNWRCLEPSKDAEWRQIAACLGTMQKEWSNDEQGMAA